MGRVWANPRGSHSAPLQSGAGPGWGDSPWDSPPDPPRKQTGRRGSSRVTRGVGRVPGHFGLKMGQERSKRLLTKKRSVLRG
ncbi:hypothetical protein PSTT_01577 [Puccinia striiformis]|uniref:Uncharacterized protein n=1 Tax=Puccinia striiformis TaxID=27350 RepID=A0A2S4W2Q4_9BASI|nr:hypothetical protein PSTT_01577 [Puccinia striiformis]